MNQKERIAAMQPIAYAHIQQVYKSALKEAKKDPEVVADYDKDSPEEFALMMTEMWLDDSYVSDEFKPYQEMSKALRTSFKRFMKEVK